MKGIRRKIIKSSPLTPYSSLLSKRGWGDLYKDKGVQGGFKKGLYIL